MTSCAECGYDWEGAHERAASTIAALAGQLTGVIQASNVLDADNRLRTRPVTTVWSPLEYMAHVADAMSWYSARIELALGEVGATFSGLDWDAHTETQRYHERRLDAVLEDVERECRRLASTLEALVVADWHRAGIGSDGQPRTIAALAHRAAHEAQHHLRDITLILAKAHPGMAQEVAGRLPTAERSWSTPRPETPVRHS